MSTFSSLAAIVAIDKANAFLVYLALTLGVLLSLWIFHGIRQYRRKIELTDIQLFTCEYCQQRYIEQNTKIITKCPACASFNKQAS